MNMPYFLNYIVINITKIKMLPLRSKSIADEASLFWNADVPSGVTEAEVGVEQWEREAGTVATVKFEQWVMGVLLSIREDIGVELFADACAFSCPLGRLRRYQN